MIMNSVSDIWDRVLDILRKELTETTINTFFDDCTAVDFVNNRFYIHCPSELKKNTIESRYIGMLKSALSEIFSGDVELVILDDDDLSAFKQLDYSEELYLEEYTFDTFVVGNSNRFAHAAALAVGDGNKKTGYNPLFIYGESGLGKTHLLHAIRHSISRKFPHYKIVYIKGDEFLNELILAIRQATMVDFRDKYRGADLFLVDDIQFIAGKIETQEEFFNTFNTLYESGKQIVFTSDRSPSEIHRLEDRLKTRFESGLSADIQPPDDALRVAIIKNKAEQHGVIISDDVINYIAENLDSNVRQLEGAVKIIIACRELMNEEITVESVKQRLKDLFKGSRDTLPTAEKIIEETAKFYKLNPEDIFTRNKMRNTVTARQVAMYLTRSLTNLTFPEIGAIFKRDHSTVMHSVDVVEKRKTEDIDFSNTLKDITTNINTKNISAMHGTKS